MRYAIYFLPDAASALWHFGSAMLGYDSVAGADAAFPQGPAFAGLSLPSLTSEPRTYGFHATLKAPFHLAGGRSEAELLDHAAGFAARHRAFDAPALRLCQPFGRFLALGFETSCAPVSALADAAVSDFDRFRAPPSEAELARRLAHPLPERQMRNLRRWGYPFVFEDFFFHMTLTNALDAPTLAALHAAVAPIFAPMAGPVPVDAIAVCVQPAPQARFKMLARFALPG